MINYAGDYLIETKIIFAGNNLPFFNLLTR